MIVSVYTDGSSHRKGGLPYGWAYVIPGVTEGFGGGPSGTNNVAELSAAIEGLRWLKEHFELEPHSRILKLEQEAYQFELVCDSQYVLGIASGAYTPTKNLDLATELRGLYLELGCWRTRWVKGHSGDENNEKADKLATAAKNQQIGWLK